jgi:hypothetical protein
MVIASEPEWLHTLGQIAGTVLLIELGFVLLIVAALVVGFAVAAWWVHRRVVPVVSEHAPQALDAMRKAQQGTDRVASGVAEFYGRRQQVETAIRVLLFGRGAAQRVRQDSLARAQNDLQLMNPPEETPGPANGFTPRLVQPAETERDAHPAGGRAREAAQQGRVHAGMDRGQARQDGDLDGAANMAQHAG